MDHRRAFLRYEDYTVGIICALVIELNALRHMLDQEHARLRVKPHDSNIYVVGEVSLHNVVIACLPGSQGKGPSAISATNMARTFPSVRYRLVFGIGGGMPSSKNDIRLGDVIVGVANDEHGGVVQYDHGKDTESGFIRKGLNTPPLPMLRSAVYKMPLQPDILFAEDYAHQPGQDLCEKCDSTKAVQRSMRLGHRPRIFYGLIASGDRVVKSAMKRKAITEALGGDVLCFEMEAAGLMNEFPCLVIRGVSDYADTHKNDSWQPYAAANAAACAKELLSYLEPPESPANPLAEVNNSANLGHGSNLLPAPGPTDIIDRFLEDLCETDPQNEMTRIRQSTGDLLEQCYVWILHSPELERWQTQSEARLLWMMGGPGKGKTMAMIGLVDILNNKACPSPGHLAYFFCQDGVPHLNDAVSVLRGLIWRLLWTNRHLSKYIPAEYRCKMNRGKEIFDGPNAFAILTTMLFQILEDDSLDTVFLLIDAVDECAVGMHGLLDWIVSNTSRLSSKAKWLLSSRRSPEVEEYLRPGPFRICLSLESGEKRVSDAVNYFIDHRVAKLAERKSILLSARKGIEAQLKEKAGLAFLWVALVCQHLQATSRRKIHKELIALPSGLEPLYDRMLQQIERHADEDDRSLSIQVLRATITARRPLNHEELAIVTGFPETIMHDISYLVGLCHSFLTMRRGYVFFVHQSARDYFVYGLGRRIFEHGITHEHKTVLHRLLEAMPDPLASLGYAVTSWVDHLVCFCNDDSTRYASVGLVDGGVIEGFIKSHLLHWLEALGLMRQVRLGLMMTRRLKHLLDTNNAQAPGMLNMIQDAYQFILYNKACLETAPLQVYYSALIFSPRATTIRRLFHKEAPPWLTNPDVLDEKWSPGLQVFEGHTDPVCAVTFTPDNRLLVSGSYDGTVRTWDTDSGANLLTRTCDSWPVLLMIVSPCGEWVASAVSDSTLQIWNLHSGELKMALHTSGWITSMAFSTNSCYITFISTHKTVQRWSIQNRAMVFSYEIHATLADPTVVSPDGQWIASACEDGDVGLWEVGTGFKKKFFKPSMPVKSLTFLPGSVGLAAITYEDIIHVWNIETGSLELDFDPGTDRPLLTGRLSDGRRIVVTAYETIRVWDTENQTIVQSFAGHTDLVQSVAMASDGLKLASASKDKTIRLWNVNPAVGQQNTLIRRRGAIMCLGISPSGKTVASSSMDQEVRLCQMETGSLLQVFEHPGEVVSLAFSSDSHRLATSSADGTICFWDCSTGVMLDILDYSPVSSGNLVTFDHFPPFDRHRRMFLTHDPVETETTLARENVSYEHPWIIYNGNRLLWLPVTYQPCHYAVNGHHMVIGCYTGQLLMFKLPPGRRDI
ncbi:WD40 repeat-like protein [Aspergillus egyptiacus]|nr:WD40 repeat-like protein [Aspergillus egyptiacus]